MNSNFRILDYVIIELIHGSIKFPQVVWKNLHHLWKINLYLWGWEISNERALRPNPMMIGLRGMEEESPIGLDILPSHPSRQIIRWWIASCRSLTVADALSSTPPLMIPLPLLETTVTFIFKNQKKPTQLTNFQCLNKGRKEGKRKN